MKCLIFSSGFTEDQTGVTLYNALRKSHPNLSASAIPLEGEGFSYNMHNLALSHPGLHNIQKKTKLTLSNKLKTISKIIYELIKLNKKKKHYNFTLCIGTKWTLLLSIVSGIRPIYLLPTFKKGGSYSISTWIYILTRSFVRVTYLPNPITTEIYQNKGIRTMFFGNIANQNKKLKNSHFYIEKQQVILAFLLDANKKTKDHLSSFLNTIETIAKAKTFHAPKFIIGHTPNVWFSQLVEQAQDLGWTCSSQKNIFCLKKGKDKDKLIEVLISEDYLTVIKTAHVALTESITLSEQALDAYCPIIMFATSDSKNTKKHLKNWLQIIPKQQPNALASAIHQALLFKANLPKQLQLKQNPSAGIASHIAMDISEKQR
eukprot:COSAG05_NODE_863_length_6893_cov_2.138652_3_plen_374_part_00